MKKMIIATVLVLGLATMQSCKKEGNSTPTAAVVEHNTASTKKDLGTAD